MVAYRADFGSLGAHNDMSAVAALPHLHLALGEDLLRLHIVQQCAVTLLVVLFDGGHATELGGQLMETLRLGGFGEAFVHVGPLVVFTVSGGCEVLGGAADAVQLLEPQLGMLLLVFGGLQEKGGNLLKTLLLGLGGEVGVLVPAYGLLA